MSRVRRGAALGGCLLLCVRSNCETLQVLRIALEANSGNKLSEKLLNDASAIRAHRDHSFTCWALACLPTIPPTIRPFCLMISRVTSKAVLSKTLRPSSCRKFQCAKPSSCDSQLVKSVFPVCVKLFSESPCLASSFQCKLLHRQFEPPIFKPSKLVSFLNFRRRFSSRSLK